MPNNEALEDRWTCNTWQTQPGQQAAVDQSAYGCLWTDDAWAASDDEPPGEPPMPTIEERYQALLADWPNVSAVISADKHISKNNTAAQKHWEERWKEVTPENPLPEMECGDYARYQMYVARCDARSSSSGYQTYRKDTLVNLDRTVDGLNYVKRTLAAGMPVYVGVWLIRWEPDKIFNADKTTNHFVVLVGMGKDDNRAYLVYYDSLDDSAKENRLCLKPNLEVRACNDDGYSILTQIRVTVRF